MQASIETREAIPEDEIVLTLSAKEAKDIIWLCGKIGGTGKIRSTTDALYYNLIDAVDANRGYEISNSDVNSQLDPSCASDSHIRINAVREDNS